MLYATIDIRARVFVAMQDEQTRPRVWGAMMTYAEAWREDSHRIAAMREAYRTHDRRYASERERLYL